MKKRIIWSNRDIDFDQWKEDYIAHQKEYENDDCKNVSDEDVWDWIHMNLDYCLDNERMNLNVETKGRIIAIANLGLWNGRRQGYRILGKNISEIFRVNEDYNEYYSDGHSIKATCIHHDGVNCILYRVIREDRNIDNLLTSIYNGHLVSSSKLNYYTKSLLPYVKKVYGW